MKFFVYANKSDVKNTSVQDGRAIYFVPELKMRDWASRFDPGVMEFCGVSIEAEDKMEAKEAFLAPLDCGGLDKMFAEQEPLLTRHRSQRHESKEKVGDATMDLMVTRLAGLWLQIDEMLRAVAQLYVLKHNDLTEQEAYAKLKKEWLERYEKM